MAVAKKTDANIFLIGYRATGKSLIGKLLAEKLRKSFVDADCEFERQYGSITDFVAKSGWSEFRQGESRLLQDFCRRKDLVVATGGGVILAPENRRLLQAGGRVFALRARPETVYKRILADEGNLSKRPSLTGAENLFEEILTTMAEREGLYLDTAEKTFVVDELSPAAVVNLILASL